MKKEQYHEDLYPTWQRINLFKRALLWFIHIIVSVKTGFTYETRKGTKWYILATSTTVRVFWREDYKGPHYRIPRAKWYQFVEDMNVKFIGIEKE